MPENGTKYLTIAMTRILMAIIVIIIGGVYTVAIRTNSLAQDNRVEVRGINATLEAVQGTLIRIEGKL